MNECRNCRYSEPSDGNEIICKRFPNEVQKYMRDYCGEWRPHLEGAVPWGYALVPIEPSSEMLNAYAYYQADDDRVPLAVGAFRKMLEKAKTTDVIISSINHEKDE